MSVRGWGERASDDDGVGWLGRLRQGLSRSSTKLTEGIAAAVSHRRLDEPMLEALEEALIAADIGPATAARLVADLSQSRFGRDVTDLEVREFLAGGIEAAVDPVARIFDPPPRVRPYVVLVVGVNGTGKTTTIGKLAHVLAGEGRRVMLAAGDTFRAAAVEQLKIWGQRTGAPVIARETGADAASLAYEALEAARVPHPDGKPTDILLIDTAGRLHNKANLMAELEKIVRVLKKLDPLAPHATLLTLDATTGQNAHAQVETFQRMVNVTGLVLTKLDGSAKGGVLVALAERFKLPVYLVGVGETLGDLRPFEARAYARGLMGLV